MPVNLFDKFMGSFPFGQQPEHTAYSYCAFGQAKEPSFSHSLLFSHISSTQSPKHFVSDPSFQPYKDYFFESFYVLVSKAGQVPYKNVGK